MNRCPPLPNFLCRCHPIRLCDLHRFRIFFLDLFLSQAFLCHQHYLLFSIFLQIILGAWVRLTGSGMSCPDWPLCYGMLFPTPGKIGLIENIQYTYFQIFLEWIHRANAAFIIGPICVIFSCYFFELSSSV